MDAGQVDELILSAIREGVFPGACYAVCDAKGLRMAAHGRHTYCPDDPPTTLGTVWDLASVSKVVGTTTGAMILFEQGKLDLDRPVAELLPEFGKNGKDRITPRNLLVHDSGLVAFRPYHKSYQQAEDVLKAIYAEGLTYPTGTKSVYSDLSMIVLAKLMERITGQPLDEYLRERVFRPLKMTETTYRPEIRRCAPTETVEPWRDALHRLRGQRQFYGQVFIQGEVHDPTATVLGGVAGHAGLFSTLDDLVKFMQFMLTGGIVRLETIRMFTAKQSDLSSRGLGWDTKSPEGSSAGTKFGPRSFGHTGYTGTSVWCDPDAGRFAILLTNRVHPTAENTKILAFRPKFHDAL